MQMPIESMNLMMLNVGIAHHDADWNWQDVNSPFTRIFYVVEGRARLLLQDRCVTLRPDHLYIIPAYTLHSYECNGHFTHYYLHVYEGFKNELDVVEQYDFPTEVKAEDIDALLFQHFFLFFKLLLLGCPSRGLPGITKNHDVSPVLQI